MARHEPATEGTKQCKRCEQELPVTQFRVDRSILGGRGNTCKSCVNAALREKMNDPQFRESERVRSLEKTRRTRAAMSPDELGEHYRKGSRKWRAANPELSYEWGRRSKLKHRVLKAGGVWVEHVEPLVVLELDDGLCGICGEEVDPFDFDMDHIIPASKGGEHSYANVQIAHPACNQRKHNKILEAA